jgi:rubrerythrin
MNESRYSFGKNNLNVALAMGKNNYGHTVLQQSQNAENIEIDANSQPHDSEFEPHISASGTMVHNQSILNSPQIQQLLKNFSNANPTEHPQEKIIEEPMIDSGESEINGEFTSVSGIDTFAREFEDREQFEYKQEVPKPTSEKTRRVFATKTLVKYCTDCGFAFNTEKFCPHCGLKRATYTTPNA